MFLNILRPENENNMSPRNVHDYAVIERFIPEEWNPTPTYFDTFLCVQRLMKCENQTSVSTLCNIYTEIMF
jgi:hypothetical protein